MARRRRSEPPPVGEVRQALKALDELRATLKDCAELDHRIDAMERDKRLFAAEVGEVGAALGLTATTTTPRGSPTRSSARVARARGERAPARGEEQGARGGARRRWRDRRGARGQREARLRDDGLLRRRRRLPKSPRGSTTAGGATRCATRSPERRGAILALNVANAFDAARAALEDGGPRRARARSSASSRPAQADDEAASTRRASPPTARRSGGSRRSAATTRWRASRRSGARSWRRSRTARGAI